MNPSAFLFVCIVLLIVCLFTAYLIWRFCTCCREERLFELAADKLEKSASDCLVDFDQCNFVSDPQKTLDCQIDKFRREQCLPALEKESRAVEFHFEQLRKLFLPCMQRRLLRCHERLIRLEWAMDACNFPTVCNRIAGWIPNNERRLRRLYNPLPGPERQKATAACRPIDRCE